MRQVWTMTVSDLRQRVRDRSVIIFAIFVPLALMLVLNLVLGGALDPKLGPTTVAASVPDNDPLAAALLHTVRSLDGQGGLRITVRPAAAEQVHELTRDDTAQVGLIVPEGFGASFQAGHGAGQAAAKQVTIVKGNGRDIEQQVIISVVKGTVDRLTAGAVAASAAAGSGATPAELLAIGQQVATAKSTIRLTQGKAANEQLSASGALVAGQAGLFLLFTVGFGVLGLVNEREQGTLARLRSMPMRPWTIVAAKGLSSFVLGVVATTVLLVGGGRFFGVGFGSPVAVAVLLLAAVAAATSLMFIIARVARTAEQASIAQSIIAMVLGIAGGAFFPISATGLAATLIDLNPVSAFTRGLGITAGGGGVMDLGVPLAVLLAFAAVMLLVARIVPDRGTAL